MLVIYYIWLTHLASGAPLSLSGTVLGGHISLRVQSRT